MFVFYSKYVQLFLTVDRVRMNVSFGLDRIQAYLHTVYSLKSVQCLMYMESKRELQTKSVHIVRQKT